MITQVTWSNPEEEIARKINLYAFLMFVRLLLSSVAFFAMVYWAYILVSGIKNGANIAVNLPLVVALYTVALAFCYYRSVIVWGMTKPVDEEEMFSAAGGRLLFALMNVFPSLLYVYSGFLDLPIIRIIALVLPVVMAVLTFAKEYLIVFLIVTKRYDCKKGSVLSSERVQKSRGRRFARRGFFVPPVMGMYIIYDSLFEDEAGRTIPVLAGWTAHMKYRANDHKSAILLRLKFGKNYLYYLV